MGPNPFPEFLGLILDIIFPPVCLLCGRATPSGHTCICQVCWAEAKPIYYPFCHKCGRPIISPDLPQVKIYYQCSLCRQKRWAFDSARAGYVFDGPVRKAIHQMKYNGHFKLGRWLARELIEAINTKQWVTGRDEVKGQIVLPVPLAPERIKQREFNQSYLLAKPISQALNIPLGPRILERSKGAPPQVGLSKKERWSNVRGQFKVTKSEAIKNKQVILIDDVFTTGATVNECAKVLKQAGAVGVKVCTLARTIELH